MSFNISNFCHVLSCARNTKGPFLPILRPNLKPAENIVIVPAPGNKARLRACASVEQYFSTTQIRQNANVKIFENNIVPDLRLSFCNGRFE